MPKKRYETAPGGSNTSVPALGSRTKAKNKTPVVEFDKGDNEFITLEAIPVFDAHSGQEDNLPIEFDEATLKTICEKCNARIADTGDLVPLTDRHTSDDPDAPAPEILGYAKNFRLGTIGKQKPRPCIVADFEVFKSKMEKVKARPRRSIELWPDMVIDPVVCEDDKPPIDTVALLDGGTRPARDLGLLFQKKSRTKSRYREELQCAKEHMNPEELIKQCVEALTNTPEFAWIRDQMGKQQAEEDGEPEAYSEEEQEEKLKEEEDGDKAKMEEDEEDDKAAPAKLRMQRDQAKRKYARLENQYKALFSKVAALEKDKLVAQRKADLLSLEGEGYDFDMADELEYVTDMEPKRYQAHLSKIKKHYRKAPVGVNITPARVQAEGGRTAPAASPADVYSKMAPHYKTGKTFSNKPEEGN